MTLVRVCMLLAVAAPIGAVTMTAQGPPTAPAMAARTWSDADYDKLMKEVGPTFGATRKAIDAQNVELLKTNADKLEELFEQVDDFWASRNVKDAVGWADDAAEHAEHIEDAADAKDFAKAGEHAKLLQAQCASCHAKYRDKDPNGGFRIKP